METRVFKEYQRMVHEKSGIALQDGKESLVDARVAKRMRELKLTSHDDYLKVLREDKTGEELVRFLDAISTNVTSFFRENYHFEFVEDLMRTWLEQGQTRFRFWSAASSTGEEPYSLAITLLEALAGRKVDLRILATDISQRVLQHASLGEYREESMKSVPERLRRTYFEKQDERYKVRPELRSMITYSRLNLSQPPYPMKGPFDVIFCRNVMIYFDKALRAELLKEFHRLLRPGGFLLVGHAESLLNSDRLFVVQRPTVYLRK